jgi:diguanylate cyclase (GGDEF)-like protein
MSDETRQRILIVDDMPTNIRILGEALRQDYAVSVATDGDQALAAALGATSPDLVLLDIMMPGMDGYEVCRRLKADPAGKAIPVIFVTALGEAVDEERGLSLGAVDYIAKPFSVPVVLARVRNHLELARKTRMLERLALVDGLTEVANRRNLDETLDREWRRARRDSTSLAAIMCDIDHFKAYNDNYGHGAGDVCLRQVARTLAHTVARPGDVLGRYGGEEFLALLPDTTLAAARDVAERMRQAVFDRALPHAHSSAADRVTLSLGVAAQVPADVDTAESLLKAADQALYRAKNAGRNRVGAPTED